MMIDGEREDRVAAVVIAGLAFFCSICALAFSLIALAIAWHNSTILSTLVTVISR